MHYAGTLPLIFLAIFDVVYVIVCLFIYARFFKSLRKHPFKVPALINYGTVGVGVVTIVSTWIMTRWIIQQITNGCTYTFFWNPNCYDLNQFNRAWFAIVVVIGINIAMLVLALDIRRQNNSR